MRTESIKHIIWDWNGTLLDDISACLASINTMLRKRHYPETDKQRYREIFGFPVQDCYRALGFDFAVEDWDCVAAEYHDIYEKLSRDSPLREGALAALQGLHARSISMAILSASKQTILDKMVGERKIGLFFRQIRGLQDLYARSKLEVGRSLIVASGIPPEQTLLVGDTTHDYEVALELKCRCVLLTGGHQTRERLDRCGCDVLDKMEDILFYEGISVYCKDC